MSAALQQFAKQKYLNLETFRKSGAGVQTPMWFVEEGDVLYTSAPSHTGKVKRLRNSGRVRVAPCDAQGKALGEWHEAEASFAEGPVAERADVLLKRKYGVQRWALDLFGKLRGWKYTMIAIRL